MRCKNCLQELEASAEACINCGALVNPPPVDYFYTAPLRLWFFYLFAFFYPAYWFYRNWTAIKKAEHRRIYPFWRGIFAIFFCYSLFKHIGRAATAQGYKSALSPQLLAILYIASSLLPIILEFILKLFAQRAEGLDAPKARESAPLEYNIYFLSRIASNFYSLQKV